jgi:predicted nuclease of predicted toxin-antitoxin system
MKIICDVHISFKVTNFLNQEGFEAVHVNHILDGDVTKDQKIADYADKNEYAILTKDMDFQHSHFIKSSPKKLIKINLGNISTKILIEILASQIETIKEIFVKQQFLIEIDKDFIRIIDSEKD